MSRRWEKVGGKKSTKRNTETRKNSEDREAWYQKEPLRSYRRLEKSYVRDGHVVRKRKIQDLSRFWLFSPDLVKISSNEVVRNEKATKTSRILSIIILKGWYDFFCVKMEHLKNNLKKYHMRDWIKWECRESREWNKCSINRSWMGYEVANESRI